MKPNNPFAAGCSAMSWETQDGKHLFGRNFDFNRMAGPTRVTFAPAGCAYRTHERGAMRRSAHAVVGMGLHMPGLGPLFYDGGNDAGLMGAQLYYREHAQYAKAAREGTEPLQPPALVTHLLSSCASVREAVACLQRDHTLVDWPLLGATPPLHWMFADRTGACAVLEPDADGLHVYENGLGVLANSPSFPWHRTNLLNYAGLRARDHGPVRLSREEIAPCFSGSGLQGLPGDFSSPSRFVRLCFLRALTPRAAGEAEGVTRLLHLFASAAFPLGAAEVGEPGEPIESDEGVVPWDYTIYTAVFCAESGRYYWTSYENPRVQFVELSALKNLTEMAQFDLGRAPDFLCRTQGPCAQRAPALK